MEFARRILGWRKVKILACYPIPEGATGDEIKNPVTQGAISGYLVGGDAKRAYMKRKRPDPIGWIIADWDMVTDIRRALPGIKRAYEVIPKPNIPLI